MKLLLVDDVELFLDLEKSFLDRKSFTTDTAQSGKEALDRIRADKPDLVLLDLFMPEMDGDEVCRQIKGNQATKDIIVIMTSSESADGSSIRERCLAAGCDDFIPKPIQRRTLLHVIEESLHLAKREHVRVPTHLPCTVTQSGDPVNTWIHTIAVGGAFIELTPTPGIEEEMTVNFSFPRNPEAIKAKFVVRWARKSSADGPAGVGVQFLDISDRDMSRIMSYVQDKERILNPHRGT
jgi:CheY-like chemotaxis protein